jgi:hypothetical protein
MRYQDFQQRLGNLAHGVATAQFKLQHPAQHLLYHNVLCLPSGKEVAIGNWGVDADIGRPIRRGDLGDPYLGWLLICLQTRKGATFPLEPSSAGSSRQPDLASIELHDVYEIKPDTPSQRWAGKEQLRAFRNLLQQGDREYLATQQRYPSELYPRLAKTNWTEGIRFLSSPQEVSLGPLGSVILSFSRAGPGLIVWDTNANRKEVKERVVVIARDALKIVQTLPETEEKADRRARELIQQKPDLARATATLVGAFGAAVVVIALTAAIVTLSPAAAGIAVIFAFALALASNANVAGPVPIVRG